MRGSEWEGEKRKGEKDGRNGRVGLVYFFFTRTIREVQCSPVLLRSLCTPYDDVMTVVFIKKTSSDVESRVADRTRRRILRRYCKHTRASGRPIFIEYIISIITINMGARSVVSCSYVVFCSRFAPYDRVCRWTSRIFCGKTKRNKPVPVVRTYTILSLLSTVTAVYSLFIVLLCCRVRRVRFTTVFAYAKPNGDRNVTKQSS